MNTMKYPLAPDTSIEVGDFVRSFDCYAYSNCYVEGHVAEIRYIDDCDHYVIKVVTKVFEGKEVEVKERWVYVPVNGVETSANLAPMGVVPMGVELIKKFVPAIPAKKERVRPAHPIPKMYVLNRVHFGDFDIKLTTPVAVSTDKSKLSARYAELMTARTLKDMEDEVRYEVMSTPVEVL